MKDFIAGAIILARKTSLEAGKAKYRSYFLNIPYYKKYKEGTDKILTAKGYADCIVSE